MNNSSPVTLFKRCSKCGESKQPTDFGVDRSRHDGLTPCCKICRRADAKARYDAADPDARRLRTAQRYQQNREVLAEKREERRPEVRAAARRRYAEQMTDPDKRAAYNEYHRNYRASHRGRIREISSAHHKKTAAENPEQIVEKSRRRHDRERLAGKVTPEVKSAVFAAYGPLCYLYGSPADVVDHDQPLAAGGSTTIENLRPACFPCNARKGSIWPFDEDELRARILSEYDAVESTEAPSKRYRPRSESTPQEATR